MHDRGIAVHVLGVGNQCKELTGNVFNNPERARVDKRRFWPQMF